MIILPDCRFGYKTRPLYPSIYESPITSQIPLHSFILHRSNASLSFNLGCCRLLLNAGLGMEDASLSAFASTPALWLGWGSLGFHEWPMALGFLKAQG